MAFGLSDNALAPSSTIPSVVDAMKQAVEHPEWVQQMSKSDSAHAKIWEQIGVLLQTFKDNGLIHEAKDLMQWPDVMKSIDTLSHVIADTKAAEINDLVSSFKHSTKSDKAGKALEESNLVSFYTTPFAPSSGINPFLQQSIFPLGSLGSFAPRGSLTPPAAQPLCTETCSAAGLPKGLTLASDCRPGSPCDVKCPAGYSRNNKVDIACLCEAPAFKSMLVPSTFSDPICIREGTESGNFCTIPQVMGEPYKFTSGAPYCHPGGIMPNTQSVCSVTCPAGSSLVAPTNGTLKLNFTCTEQGPVDPPNFSCLPDAKKDACWQVKAGNCSRTFERCLDLGRYANNGADLLMPMCPCLSEFTTCLDDQSQCLEALASTAFSAYSLAVTSCSDGCRTRFKQMTALCSEANNPYCLKTSPDYSCCYATQLYSQYCPIALNSAASQWLLPNYQNSDCEHITSNIPSFQAKQCLEEHNLGPSFQPEPTPSPETSPTVEPSLEASPEPSPSSVASTPSGSPAASPSTPPVLQKPSIAPATPSISPSITPSPMTESSGLGRTVDQYVNSWYDQAANSSDAMGSGEIFGTVTSSFNSIDGVSPGYILAGLVVIGTILFVYRDRIVHKTTVIHEPIPVATATLSAAKSNSIPLAKAEVSGRVTESPHTDCDGEN